jgi:hypothetical protein
MDCISRLSEMSPGRRSQLPVFSRRRPWPFLERVDKGGLDNSFPSVHTWPSTAEEATMRNLPDWMAHVIIVALAVTMCIGLMGSMHFGSCNPTGTGSRRPPPPSTPPPGEGTAIGSCLPHDQCSKGAACNLTDQKCYEVSTSGCGSIGQECCAPTSPNPSGCTESQCVDGVCQPCGQTSEVCCGGDVTTQFCSPGLQCAGGYCSK